MSTYRRWLFVILAASFALRVWFAVRAQGMDLLGDMGAYERVARGLVRGKGFVLEGRGWWPPAFPLLWAGCWKLFGANLFYLRLGQAILSTVAVYFCHRIARAIFDAPRLVLIATACAGLYPTTAAMSSYLWSESLYIFFFTGAVAAWFDGIDRGRLRWFILSGLSFGLAALTKAFGLYTAVPWIAWHLWYAPRDGRRLALRQVAAFLVPVVLVILPWTARNYLRYDRFILIDTTLGRTLWDGQNFQPAHPWDYGVESRAIRSLPRNRPRCYDLHDMKNPGDLDRCETRNSLQFMRDYPDLVISRIPTKLADLFAPTSPMVRVFAQDYYKPPPSGFGRYGMMGIDILAWLIVGVGVVLDLTLLRYDRWRYWLAGLIVYYLVLHAATFGMSRYRTTLEPFLVLMAVQGWRYGPPALVRSRGIGGRALACYALLALVLFMWSTRRETGINYVLGYFL